MPVIIANLSADPRLRADLYLKAAIDGLIEGIAVLCDTAIGRARDIIHENGTVDRGNLWSNLFKEVSVKQTLWGTQVEGTVVASEPYARYVEGGRQGRKSSPANWNPDLGATAAWPPVPIIREWVRRHYEEFAPLGRTPKGKARRSRKAGGPMDKAIDTLTYLIGRKIAEHGIEAAPFMQPALDEIKPIARTVIVEAVRAKLGSL